MKNKDNLYEESKKAVQEGGNNKSSQLVVYKSQEEIAEKQYKINKSKKAREIIGSIIFVVAVCAAAYSISSCVNDKKASNEITVSYNDDELKTIYIDKETYHKNVQSLAQYLNNYGNKNVKLVDLNSFYYLANMDNIKSSTFKELVEEGYLPDSETDIIIHALGIMDDLRDTVALEGIAGKEASVDYSKIFVNSRTAKVFSSAQDVYNNIVRTSQGDTRDSILKDKNVSIKEQLTKLGETEDNYELGENTLNVDISEFGTLSAAEQVLYYNLQAKTFDILLANYGVSVGGEARVSRIDDISNLVFSLRGKFTCLQEENGKTYQK